MNRPLQIRNSTADFLIFTRQKGEDGIAVRVEDKLDENSVCRKFQHTADDGKNYQVQFYNPAIHHRRSIRLKGYDYSQAGLYFVTICCQDRICRFGRIEHGEMILNEFGKIAYEEWGKLPQRFPNIGLDAFQIMPNHIHAIIAVGATLAVAPNDHAVEPNDHAVEPNDHAVAPNDHAVEPNDIHHANGATARVAPTHTVTVGDIVGAYKSLVTDKCLEIYKSRGEYMGKLLQRNYWEHIIRNEQSYEHIADYIVNNPKNWDSDKFHRE